VPDVDIRFTGLRPGEKLNETLFSAQEGHTQTSHPQILSATSNPGEEHGAPLAEQLPALCAAAEHNDPSQVRRVLAQLLPGFPASETTQPRSVMTDPYPDDF
jgi:FlaA1/EpsC-like NDP-sugar epimerase